MDAQPQFTIETLTQLKNLLAPAQTRWIPVVAAIGGALVGGLVSFIPNAFLEYFKTRRMAAHVDAALQAEVAALMLIVEDRGYVADIEKVIAGLGEDENRRFSFSIQVADPVGPVYKANLEHIGLLEALRAAKFVRFYQLLESLAIDFRPGGLAAEGGTLRLFMQNLLLAREVIRLGHELAG